jgi:hypothetical protein
MQPHTVRRSPEVGNPYKPYRFNPFNNTWTALASDNTPPQAFRPCSASTKDDLSYIFGGIISGKEG